MLYAYQFDYYTKIAWFLGLEIHDLNLWFQILLMAFAFLLPTVLHACVAL